MTTSWTSLGKNDIHLSEFSAMPKHQMYANWPSKALMLVLLGIYLFILIHPISRPLDSLSHRKLLGSSSM
jgi:hypothetical protein